MKKIKIAAALLCMTMFLTACGGKEQSETYRMVSEQNGISMTDTMTFDAKGDVIQTITEVIELDMSSFDDKTLAPMSEYYDELVGKYQEIDGVQCTSEEKDKIYTITVTIDATSDAISELSEQGLMTIQGDSNGKFSLKGSGESLEASGFEKVE